MVSRQEGDTAWVTTPICDWGQSEVKRSWLKLVKQTVKATVKASVAPGTQWAWLMQGSRLNFQCSQAVEHENLMVKNFDPSCGWKYRQLCSVTPLPGQFHQPISLYMHPNLWMGIPKLNPLPWSLIPYLQCAWNISGSCCVHDQY